MIGDHLASRKVRELRNVYNQGFKKMALQKEARYEAIARR